LRGMELGGHIGSRGTTGARDASGERPASRLRAQQVEVSVPHRVPPAARLHPLLTLFVSEEETAISQAPPLQALFALLDQAGAVEVRRRTHAHTSWHLMDAEQERPEVALRLEISEPADARGVVEVVMDATDYERAWDLLRDGHWLGITSDRRLHPHLDGSALPVDETFPVCIPVDADPPPELAAMARTAG
jgi:hypothetical protein